jgi:hypothetical protein
MGLSQDDMIALIPWYGVVDLVPAAFYIATRTSNVPECLADPIKTDYIIHLCAENVRNSKGWRIDVLTW